MAKKALGRGLNALIPSELTIPNSRTSSQKSDEIDISKIESGSNQPRQFFDKKELQGLADSIISVGIIEPLIVRPKADGYEIVAGERRWRAAKIAGLKKVPAIIRNLTDEEVREIALIENIQREELNPIEEAAAFKELIDQHRLRQDDLAKRIGKSRAAVTNALRLLRLPEMVQKYLINGELSAGHARALLMLQTKTGIGNMAEKAVKEGLSVRELEKIASRKNQERKTIFEAKGSSKTPEIMALESRLEEMLGTRVVIKHGKKGGKIEIVYYNADDLERIMESIEQQ